MLRFFRRKENPKQVLKKLLDGYTLPSFPEVAMRAMTTLRNDEKPLAEAGEVLMSDPGLSASILRTVNSATNGLRNPVKSVGHAVTMLGRSQVESLLIGVAAAGALPHIEHAHFDSKHFWRTAARRAVAARALARRLHPASQSMCFTAGLLQDMALPVLMATKNGSYGPLLHQHRRDGHPLASLEQAAFGWDHAEVAGWMCREWMFPDGLTGAIVTHHEGEDDDHSAPPAVTLVALLDDVEDDCSDVDKVIDAAHAEHGVAPDECKELLEQSFTEATTIAAMFG